MKSLFFGFLFFLFSFFTFVFPSFAKEEQPALLSEPVAETDVIFMFVRDDCGHCKDAKKFLTTSLLVNYPSTRVMYLNLEEPSIKTLFDQVTSHYELIKGTPLTLINGNLVQGYEADETTGKLFVSLLDAPHDSRSFEDIAAGGAMVVTGSSVATVCTEEGCELPGQPSYVVSLPFIGKTIDVGAFSLGSMSFILGLIDGFNPCALWVLIMFLFVLSQVGSRRRMVEYAGLFIFAETIMYYLILNVWFTAWDFISLNKIVTPLVGFLALGSGIYFLYKFYTYTPACKVTSLEQQQKMSQKVKALASKPLSVSVALGILALAFSVNIFEFACSIGIPQTYTKILELNLLTFWETQSYMFVYILGYMVDDFLVFGLAIYGMDKIGVAHTYSKWSTLLGGLLMILLGVIMLFQPELLIF